MFAAVVQLNSAGILYEDHDPGGQRPTSSNRAWRIGIGLSWLAIRGRRRC